MLRFLSCLLHSDADTTYSVMCASLLFLSVMLPLLTLPLFWNTPTSNRELAAHSSQALPLEVPPIPDTLLALLSSIKHITSYDQEQLGTVQSTLPVEKDSRAVSIEVNARTGVEGLSLPGTTVDVVLTYVDEGGVLRSKIIAERALVLSREGLTKPSYAKTLRSDSTITLQVDTRGALTILTAKDLGPVSLLLRSSRDWDRIEVDEISSEDFGIKSDRGPSHRFCPYRAGSGIELGTRELSSASSLVIAVPLFNECYPSAGVDMYE